MAEPRRSTGTVAWFSAYKGFGFIAPDDGGEDLFVHHTAIRSNGFRSLAEGQPVEFSVEGGEDGRAKAGDVAVVFRSRRGGGPRGGWRGRGAVAGFRGGYLRGGRRGGWAGGGGAACYNCGRIGHLARDCYRGSGGGGGRGGSGRLGGGGVFIGCFNCGEEGHFARECPH